VYFLLVTPRRTRALKYILEHEGAAFPILAPRRRNQA
jgi:hypothetical protein